MTGHTVGFTVTGVMRPQRGSSTSRSSAYGLWQAAAPDCLQGAEGPMAERIFLE